MVTLENRKAKVVISEKGAQVTSVFDLETQTEYCWNGDEKHWAYYNPILFPIVGSLHNNIYHVNGQDYTMGNHGFARHAMFSFVSSDKTQATLVLKSNDMTLSQYPFQFELYVTYRLINKKVEIEYQIVNRDTVVLPYQFGLHPAFPSPMSSEKTFDDCYLEFEQVESDQSEDGSVVIDHTTMISFRNNEPFNTMNSSFFYQLKSKYVDLSDGIHRVRVGGIDNFYRLGIWHKSSDAPFVCIEPQASENDTSEPLFHKRKSTHLLEPGKTDHYSYDIEIIA